VGLDLMASWPTGHHRFQSLRAEQARIMEFFRQRPLPLADFGVREYQPLVYSGASGALSLFRSRTARRSVFDTLERASTASITHACLRCFSDRNGAQRRSEDVERFASGFRSGVEV